MLTAFRKCLPAIAPIAVAALLTAPCLGQSRQGKVIANVPFPFMVADHAFPPGRYTVTPIGETNFRIHANHESLIFQTHNVAGEAAEDAGKMVFHRYGSTYILSEVWMAGKTTGDQLFVSHAEKELAQRNEKKIATLHAIPAGRCCRQEEHDLSGPR